LPRGTLSGGSVCHQSSASLLNNEALVAFAIVIDGRLPLLVSQSLHLSARSSEGCLSARSKPDQVADRVRIENATPTVFGANAVSPNAEALSSSLNVRLTCGKRYGFFSFGVVPSTSRGRTAPIRFKELARRSCQLNCQIQHHLPFASFFRRRTTHTSAGHQAHVYPVSADPRPFARRGASCQQNIVARVAWIFSS